MNNSGMDLDRRILFEVRTVGTQEHRSLVRNKKPPEETQNPKLQFHRIITIGSVHSLHASDIFPADAIPCYRIGG